MSPLISHNSNDISHFVDYCENPPDTSKIEQNSPLILKNRFEPLNISAAYTVKGYENDKKGWIFDCGATDTMTPNKDDFVSFSDITKTYI